ncbi:MAG: GlsB/YeaQ/YmgE family stress response membrane protein [Eubacteriales bacterium]|nr:GlsB/YeaQ/YmgE family stress response membrane protein [Eubacteriales bacterium]
MGILSWILVGGIAGWLAGLIMKEERGLVGNIVVGIVGAFIGGAIMNGVKAPTAGFAGFSIGSVLVALLGAIILIFVLRLIRKR